MSNSVAQNYVGCSTFFYHRIFEKTLRHRNLRPNRAISSIWTANRYPLHFLGLFWRIQVDKFESSTYFYGPNGKSNRLHAPRAAYKASNVYPDSNGDPKFSRFSTHDPMSSVGSKYRIQRCTSYRVVRRIVVCLLGCRAYSQSEVADVSPRQRPNQVRFPPVPVFFHPPQQQSVFSLINVNKPRMQCSTLPKATERPPLLFCNDCGFCLRFGFPHLERHFSYRNLPENYHSSISRSFLRMRWDYTRSSC